MGWMGFSIQITFLSAFLLSFPVLIAMTDSPRGNFAGPAIVTGSWNVSKTTEA